MDTALEAKINKLEQWVNLINGRADTAAAAANAAAAAAANAAIPDNGMIDALPAEAAAQAAADARDYIAAQHSTLRDAIAILRSRYEDIMQMDQRDDEMNDYDYQRTQLEQDIQSFNTDNVERIEALLDPNRAAQQQQARGGRRLRKRGQESRRRSSSARKSSSRRGRRSAKKRGTQRKQKRRQRRASRRAY